MYINVNWNRKGCSLNKFTKHIHRVSWSKWIFVYEKKFKQWIPEHRQTEKKNTWIKFTNEKTNFSKNKFSLKKQTTLWKWNVYRSKLLLLLLLLLHSVENNVFDRIRFCIYLLSIVNVWVGHVTVWVGHVTVWSVSAIIWVWYVDVTSQISHIINMKVSSIIHRYIFS